MRRRKQGFLVFVDKPADLGEKAPALSGYCACREKTYGADKQFLHVHVSGGPVREATHVCSVYVGNVRQFIQDIKRFNKTYETGEDEYSFEEEGVKFFDNSVPIGDCIVCDNEVQSEDAFVSFPSYAFCVDVGSSKEVKLGRISSLGLKCIHKECCSEFIDKVEIAFDENVSVEDAI